MQNDSIDRRLRTIRRFVIAGTTFKEVILLCEHIESMGEQTLTLLHVPLLAGVCVTYMKPFVRSEGLGKLPGDFTVFPSNSRHGKVHADLANLRHWFYAHRDMLQVQKLFPTPEAAEQFANIILYVEEGGRYHFSAEEISWPIEAVIRVRELCSFQRSRIDAALSECVSALCGSRLPPPGKYVLGRDIL